MCTATGANQQAKKTSNQRHYLMLSCPRCVVLRPASYHVLQQKIIYWYVIQTLKYLLHFFAYISVKTNLKYKPFRIFLTRNLPSCVLAIFAILVKVVVRI